MYIEHSAIRYLMNMPIKNGRGIDVSCCYRNLMLLFSIGLEENLVAYFLSRANNEGEVVPIEDSFLDECLFVVSMNSPSFTDIAKYLSIVNLPSPIDP